MQKEGHEKISPLHDGGPPVFAAKATLIGDVKHNHANDADATQEVEGVITMFHVGYCFLSVGGSFPSEEIFFQDRTHPEDVAHQQAESNDHHGYADA